MALSSQRAFTSATAICPWKYEVFLSFRGEDTRRGFTDYLYKQLEWRGIRTFRDDPDLQRGTDINPELLTAIEQSRFAVIVLSTNYASSSWGLRELTHIVQSMKEKERIFPIFYDVDPSDVRHQRGSFGTALVNHERNCGEDRGEVLEWRNALEKVANLAGWNSKDYRYDTELITEIVDAVWDEVHPTFSLLDSSDILVGLDNKLKEIDLHLDTSANDVRFVGIWGMGGMGKTTLARLVYERISHSFEGSSFLANVREVYATHGLVPLQKQLLSSILRKENIQVYDAYSGLAMIKRCLCNKKVLLILDDVDQSDQLEMLIREKDCFGLGSRIIITTRDERLLVEHGIEKVSKVMALTQDEALYLFSRKAFQKDDLEEDYLELSKNFINYARGLPLALKTLGSFLYKRSRDEWKSALDKLKQAPDRKNFQILKISYDGLEEMQKKIFLDVACFHKFHDKEEVIEILDSCGFVGTRIAIHVLIEKSLLSISNTRLFIHDLIQAMAWEIVRQESPDEPGGRSRLWHHSDIVHVLKNNTGTEAIEGIVLCLRKFEAAHWNPEAFTKMLKLKLLKINNLSLSLGPNYLPNSLRFLEWSWYPSKCLRLSFQPVELAELRLQHSKIDHLWNEIKYMVKLKSIDLSYSENLTRTPDFTGTQNLERLVFEGCTNIVKIHPSIASLKRLRVLNFKNCKSIMSLPSEVELESLETFDLSGCSKLKKIPEFVGEMKNFSKLSLSFTAVEQMPSSNIHSISSLKALDMSGISMRDPPSSLVPVKNIEQPRSWHSFFTFGLFPRKNPHPVSLVLASLKDLRFLKLLNLNDCNLCEGAIPEDIGLLSSLEELDLDGNHFISLPASISGLSKLRWFTLKNCRRLQKLPSLPSNGQLQYVNTHNCTSLKIFHFDPTAMCNGVRYIEIRSINCISLVDHQGSSSIIYLMLKKFLQEIPHSVEDFRIVIPGSEIPEWFSNQSVGDSVIETLPSDSNSKWVGFAFCALFVPVEEISATGRNEITLRHFFDLNTPSNSAQFIDVSDAASDHLCLIFLTRKSKFEGATGRPGTYGREKCHDRKIRFHFEVKTAYKEENRWVKMKSCLKVKNCGVRILYEQDAEELNRTMKQYSNRKNSFYEDVIDCDIDKTDKVQGAITKRTREQYCNEAGPSGIGSFGKESSASKEELKGNCVYMHDLIQKMAWEIVRQDSFDEPGGRSRLWLHSDIHHVLTNNTGTEAIEGIVLCLRKFEVAHWIPEAFTKMCKLKLLKINNLGLSLGPKYLPNSLRFLEWSWYPSKCLPPSFQPVELAELRLQHSKIDHLWNGIKYMVKLKSIDLSYSENLTRTPDFTGTQNLERLVFEGCTNLVKIHPSIASLKRLRVLNFKNCKSIKSLPSEVGLESLETFDLSGCSKLKKIPEFVGEMKNFSKLSLSFTAVEEMPSSNIHSMASLKELDMSGISMRDPPSSLVPVKNIELPRSWHSFFTFGLFPRKNPHPVSLVLASLKDLRFLKCLNLKDCNLCEGAIPEDIGLLSSLEDLNLGGNHFVSLPASISGLSKLETFTLRNCKRLQKLPSLPSNIDFSVNTDNCTSLKIFPYPPPMCNGVTRHIWISSFNCVSLVDHQGSSSIIFLMLKKFLQEIPRSLSFFGIIIPGSEIPEWFSKQSVGDSIIETLPLDSNSKWVGFAFCALFVPAQEISATATKNNFIYFRCLSDSITLEGPFCYTPTDDVASNHLWLILQSRHYFFSEGSGGSGTYWREKCHDHKIRFHFETRSSHGEKTQVKVKKCGVRSLYEEDAEELNRTMKQYSNRNNSFYEDITDCDFDKSDKVQDAITKRTREQYCNETGPSGIGTLGKESLCTRTKED